MYPMMQHTKWRTTVYIHIGLYLQRALLNFEIMEKLLILDQISKCIIERLLDNLHNKANCAK